MEKNEIMQALNGIFSAVLNQSNLQLSESMTTDDIENWDYHPYEEHWRHG